MGELFGIQPHVGGGNEVIKTTQKILLDESEHVISSLELNRIAFWTFHEASIADGEDLCELVIELLQSILIKPESHSPLTLQKTLAVARHILIHGAEVVVNQAIPLGRPVENLLNYNTILMAQKKQGLEGFFLSIKGGGVDRGGPVRDLAAKVHKLLSDVAFLRLQRSIKADPTSLVPVGNEKAAFVTDEVRLLALKKRMEHEQSMVVKSNLAKADGGFGGGYMSKDGKTHVGAAHGIEEMLKQAEREKRRFTDEGLNNRPNYNQYQVDSNAFSEYMAPDLLGDMAAPQRYPSLSMDSDLLSMNDTKPAVEVDLLGLGPAVASNSESLDLLGTGDLLPVGSPVPAGASLWDLTTSGTNTASSTGVAASTTSLWASQNLLGSLSTQTVPNSLQPALLMMHHQASPTPKVEQNQPSMKTSNANRFAALDDLFSTSSTTNQPNTSSTLSSLDAMTTQALSTLTLQSPATTNSMMPSINFSTTSLKVSDHLGGGGLTMSRSDKDNLENGFIMGGAEGTGILEPMAPAPAVAPPPPPPGSNWFG